MPIIAYKEKLKDLKVSFAFNTCYCKEYKLKIKNSDICFYEEKSIIKDTIKNFNENEFNMYIDNFKIYYVALSKYFIDKIPNIFSIKFEKKNEICTFYADEIENFLKNN